MNGLSLISVVVKLKITWENQAAYIHNHFVARHLAAMVLTMQQVIPQRKIQRICVISFIRVPMHEMINGANMHIYTFISNNSCRNSLMLFN